MNNSTNKSPTTHTFLKAHVHLSPRDNHGFQCQSLGLSGIKHELFRSKKETTMDKS